MWAFFHEHSGFTGQQGKGKAFSLTPHNHFHLLHLDITQAITAESLLHIANSLTQTEKLWFPNASCLPLRVLNGLMMILIFALVFNFDP